jgi:hypothetical protein
VFNAGGVSVLLVPPLLARNIVLIGPGTLKTLASSLRTTAVQRVKSNAERNEGTYSYDFHSTPPNCYAARRLHHAPTVGRSLSQVLLTSGRAENASDEG